MLFLMEEFGGAAGERELLRPRGPAPRCAPPPWTRYRLEEYVVDFEERPERAGWEFACFREPDDRDRGRRYFLTDLARASYAAHRREEEAREAFRKGFPCGRGGGFPTKRCPPPRQTRQGCCTSRVILPASQPSGKE
jgi:hypothetical protein